MSDVNFNLFAQIESLILEKNINEKVQGVIGLGKRLSKQIKDDPTRCIINIPVPGLPSNLELVAPRKLKRRGIQTQTGRNILMHSIAHIEFNAINLALDAAYRFRDQPNQYYQDWLTIAADEARHFSLIQRYLESNNSHYGEYPAHNGLWDMAVQTAHDVLARMALVPRVLEARGLDVTPGIITKLERVNDCVAVDILTTIYQDEISHVEKGSYWFFHHCKLRNLQPRASFIALVQEHLHGSLRGPFNLSARLLAGFSEDEIRYLLHG